jgi:GMP synthase (glutamine-hydrolysing)
MPRVLYLENSPGSDSSTGVANRLRAMSVDVTIAHAYDGEFPAELSAYDAVYLTGSPHGAYDDLPWIHREHEVIREVESLGVPMLGVCFGSEILASALCGRDEVFRRPTCEVGYVSLPLTTDAAEDPLLRGVPSPIRMFVWHNDEIRAEHPRMRILATSHDCPNHVWRYGDNAVWGIQGHPEVTRAVAPAWLEKNRATLERDGADVESLVRDRGADDAVELILPNFVEVVSGIVAARHSIEV